MSATPNKSNDILTKIYIPLKKNIFPIKFVNKKEKKILANTFKEEPFTKLIPRGIQYVEDSLDITNEDLNEMINSERDITKKIVLLSKQYDILRDINTARKLLSELNEYEDTIDMTQLQNKDSFDLFKKQLTSFIDRNDKIEQDEQNNTDTIKLEIEKTIDPVLFNYPNTSDRINLSNWILPNRKNFTKFISNTFEPIVNEYSREPIKYFEKGELNYHNAFPHQKFVSDYLSDNSPYRGLLLYHGLGSGKSCSSILVAEGFRHRKICVLLPASLHSNYAEEITKYGEMAYKKHFYWVWIKLQMNTVDLQNKVYKYLESKGIEKNLADKIIVKRNGNKGIFMIDNNQDEQNYDSMPTSDREILDKQIKTMIDYKYTILHYNAGSYCIRDIFSAFTPNFDEIKNKLYGTPNKNKFNENDLILLFNYVFNKDNKIPNPLDDKLIIVDEIHNLISLMSGSGVNGKMFYELIMRSNNSKLVFLSGTIAINSAFEFDIMFNLLRGYINTYNIKLTKINGTFKEDEIKNILSNFRFIDRININQKENLIEVSRTPYGFINNYDSTGKYTGVIKSIDGEITDEEFINLLLLQLSSKYQQYGVIEPKTYSMFPDILVNKRNKGTWIHKNKKLVDKVQDEFINKYVDTTSFEIKRDIIFKNKIVGLVSFFNEISGIDIPTGANYFPDKFYASDDEILVNMTNYQFLDYALKRQVERELEEKSVKLLSYSQSAEVNKMSMDTVNSYFRIFTRQRGIFVFPPEITRPEKKEFYKIKDDELSTNEIDTEFNSYDDTFDDEIEDNSSVNKKYELALKNAVEKLTEKHLTINDSKYSLSTLSPKYVKMLDNINKTQGLVFCYSQFRGTEGIAVFTKVLDANGYSRLFVEVKKNGKPKYIFDSKIVPGKRVRYYSGNDIWLTGLVKSVQNKEVYLDGVKEVFNIEEVYPCVYALWTGDETTEQRNAIQKYYKEDDNMFGQKCLILLASASGSEGISLYFVRQVHIMEPYWNNVRINQVIGRARRIKSHIKLPDGQRNVKVFQYKIKFSKSQINGTWVKEIPEKDIITFYDKLVQIKKDSNLKSDKQEKNKEELDIATINENFKVMGKQISNEIEKKDDGLSSDEVLFEISNKKEKILNNFLKIIQEASIDCNFNYQTNIQSDISLKNNKCYNNIQTTDPTYTFELDDTKDETIQNNVVQSQKSLIDIPISLDKLGRISAITEKVADGNYPENHPIYDYYLYNGLFYKDNTPKKLVIIGVFKNNMAALFGNFIDNKYTIYTTIEQCMKKMGKIPKDGSDERKKYIEDLKKCHLETDTYWTCFQCFHKIINDVEICSKCGIPKSISDEFTGKTTTPKKDTPKPESSAVRDTKTEAPKKKITIFKPPSK